MVFRKCSILEKEFLIIHIFIFLFSLRDGTFKTVQMMPSKKMNMIFNGNMQLVNTAIKDRKRGSGWTSSPNKSLRVKTIFVRT